MGNNKTKSSLLLNEIIYNTEGEQVKGLNYNPRSIITYVSNVRKCLEFLRNKRVKIQLLRKSH